MVEKAKLVTWNWTINLGNVLSIVTVLGTCGTGIWVVSSAFERMLSEIRRVETAAQTEVKRVEALATSKAENQNLHIQNEVARLNDKFTQLTSQSVTRELADSQYRQEVKAILGRLEETQTLMRIQMGLPATPRPGTTAR